MKRIALVVPAFPRASETFIVSKFRGLLRAGWDVHVVCGTSDPAEWRHFPDADPVGLRPRVHRTWPRRPRWLAAACAPAALSGVAVRRPRQLRRYLANGTSIRASGTLRGAYLDARLIELAPDVIHFEFGSLAVGRMHLGELLGCRIVVSFRGYDISFVGLDDPRYYEPVWRHADALHFLGSDLRDRALVRGCPPDKEHRLIPPAIDAAHFDPGSRSFGNGTGTPGQPLRILSVGRLVWKKGYEYALQAVRRLVDSGVHCSYTVIGGGDGMEPVAFARRQLGLEGVVEFRGARPPAEIRDEMLAADIFLHAAVSEGFCNAVLEAQAMKLPVVCSDAEGLRENVVDGETGFVVPRRDAPALAARMARLAADPALRRRMGEAGRARVVSRFRLSDQIAAFGELYGSVLREPATIGGEDAPTLGSFTPAAPESR
jgi:colanic acid/amylovoran biosynthesis glycosyltransferase